MINLTNIKSDPKTNKRQTVNVQTIATEQNLRYRDWVEQNREYVHKKTKNKEVTNIIKLYVAAGTT